MNINISKKFASLQEFKKLEELPNTRPFSLLNSDASIIYCNHSFEVTFSLYEGESFEKIDADPSISDLIKSLLGSNYSSFHFEFYLSLQNQTGYQNYYADIERIFIGAEQFFVLIFSSSDERKRIEDRINNLHNALEYGDVAVLITDQDGFINYSSKSFEVILNRNIEQLYKSYLPDAFVQYLNDDELELLKASIAYKKEWVKLISDISANGELWFYEIKLTPVKRNVLEAVNFIVIAHNITNYVLKNRLASQAEQKQKLIINNISDILLIVRRQGKKLIFENGNDNFFRVFEIEKDTITENDLANYVPEEFFEELTKNMAVFENANQNFCEYKYSDEFTRRKYICKLTFTDEPFNQDRLYILSLADITEQIEFQSKLQSAYEKENRLNKLKTAFLANMSHEIRTPLNAVVGYSDLLEDEIQTQSYESLGDIVHYLKDGVKRLLDLVDNIVEVSILESGDNVLDMVRINLNNFVETLIPNFKKPNSLNVVIARELDQIPIYISADETKLKKIIDMIVDNGIKYNVRNGSVILRTRLIGDLVRIEIQDTGIGIGENKIKEILEPFTQEEEEGYKRNYEGAGLGLTIASKLTELLGGRFDIKSKQNIGTSIFLTFPAIK